jgi:hypothetical protein
MGPWEGGVVGYNEMIGRHDWKTRRNDGKTRGNDWKTRRRVLINVALNGKGGRKADDWLPLNF